MQAWYDQNYQHEYAAEPHTDQQYYEGYGYAAAGYEDGSYDHAYQPPHDTQLWLYQDTVPHPTDNNVSETFSCSSIPVRKIQNVAFFVNKKVAQLAIDSGCEGDCIRVDEAKRLGIPIFPLDHTDKNATQADGKSQLDIVGKAKFNPNRDKLSLAFDGYVVRHLQSPILCGAPFLERNKIVQELHNRRIVIDGKYYIEETSPYCPNPVPEVSVSSLTFNLTRVAFTEPGDNLELVIDPKLPDQEYLVAPVY